MQALAIEAFKSLVAWFVWPALLHSLWIGLLTASIVALLFQVRERLSHPVRYNILLAAIVLAILGLAVATLVQHSITTRSDGSVDAALFTTIVVDASDLSQEPQTKAPTAFLARQAQKSSRERYVALIARGLRYVATVLQEVRLFVAAAWLLGVSISLAVLAMGAKTISRLRQEADPPTAAVQARASLLARRLRLKKSPAVLVHPRIDEPCLTGIFQPVILLPARWLASTRTDLLDAIVAHELAHARRLDHLVNVAQRLVESLLFFHPAVYWLSGSVRRQREFCTDRLAVRVTHNPLAMAHALESVARLRLSSRVPRLASTSLGGETTSLLPRIQELIGMKPSRPRSHVWPFVAMPVAGLAALVATSVGLAPERTVRSSIQPFAEPATATPQERPSPQNSKASPVTAKRPSSVLDPERQVCFEVRMMSLDAEAWRELLNDRLKFVQQEADVSVWIIDEEALTDLLNLAQADKNTNLLQAPKVTAFENASATIFNENKQHFVAQMEKIEGDESVAFRPIVKAIDVGVRMELRGALQARGTQLTVDLRDTEVLAMRTLHRKARVGDRIVAAQYQVPTPIERRCRVTCDIPDGSELLISVGLHERRGRSSNAAEAASGLLQLVGLPPVPARNVTCERLVVIKPRWIVLESEGRPVKARMVTGMTLEAGRQ